MKSTQWKFLALAFAVALSSAALVVDDSFARGGGGGGGGSRGGGFSSSHSSSSPSHSSSPSSSPSRSSSGSSSGGFFKSTPAPAPIYHAPAPAPKQTPAPSANPGFKTGTPKATEQPRTFDQRGKEGLKKEESRQAYEKAHPSTPAAPVATPSQTRERSVADLRKDLSREKWENRQLRRDQQYGRYYNQPRVFTQTYNDPFGNIFFWMWLMEQNSHSRDQWLYHHQSEVDPARFAALKEKDADLDRRLKALEKDGVKKDSSYTPEEFKGNKDLMYGDDVVTQAAKEEHSSSNLWLWLGVLLLLGAGVYLVFVKRWK